MALVLGYGALLCPRHVDELCGSSHVHSFRSGMLQGYRRHWKLLYRNGCHPDGGYVDPTNGAFFEGGVAFLGVREDPETNFAVSEITVDEVALARIDEEEYLYRRIDAGANYRPDHDDAFEGPVWLYIDAPEEYPGGGYEGTQCAVTRDYHGRVTKAAAALNPGLARHFEQTTDACPWPLLDLEWRSLGD